MFNSHPPSNRNEQILRYLSFEYTTKEIAKMVRESETAIKMWIQNLNIG